MFSLYFLNVSLANPNISSPFTLISLYVLLTIPVLLPVLCPVHNLNYFCLIKVVKLVPCWENLPRRTQQSCVRDVLICYKIYQNKSIESHKYAHGLAVNCSEKLIAKSVLWWCVSGDLFLICWEFSIANNPGLGLGD